MRSAIGAKGYTYLLTYLLIRRFIQKLQICDIMDDKKPACPFGANIGFISI